MSTLIVAAPTRQPLNSDRGRLLAVLNSVEAWPMDDVKVRSYMGRKQDQCVLEVQRWQSWAMPIKQLLTFLMLATAIISAMIYHEPNQEVASGLLFILMAVFFFALMSVDDFVIPGYGEWKKMDLGQYQGDVPAEVYKKTQAISQMEGRVTFTLYDFIRGKTSLDPVLYVNLGDCRFPIAIWDQKGLVNLD